MSARAALLKSKMGYKATSVRRFEAVAGSKTETMPLAEREKALLGVCLERARLKTESFRATEGQPYVVRNARALAHILDNMTIYIDDGELIVGNMASRPRLVQLYPELAVEWLDRAFNDGYKDMLDDRGRAEWADISSYWRGKTTSERLKAALPAELQDFIQWNPLGWTHNFEAEKPAETLDVSKVFRLGLAGIAAQVRERLNDIGVLFQQGRLPARDYVDRKDNLNAMLIALEAAARFGKRYADKARELAAKTTDPARKQELLEIAAVCDRVPANPPRTLHEAVQSFYFCNLISKQIETCGQGYGDRLDVLLNPYYQQDKADKRITRERAQELLECLFIKSAEWGYLRPPGARITGAGESAVKDFTIGGVTPDGEDATNEFSFLILDAARATHLPEPTIAVRYHSRLSPELVLKSIDVLRSGLGYPAFYNDNTIVTWLVSVGIPLEEARGYGILACVGPATPGLNVASWCPNCGYISLGKCLEMALYRGKDRDTFTGKQIGVPTPDPLAFTRIEDVMDAFMEQAKFVAGKLVGVSKVYQVVHEQYLQRPFSSTLIRGCIEEGRDCTSWRNGWARVFMAGATNAINSLAAIKKFVFDEKLVTMQELIDACRTNFEGKESLRQRLINDAPKYGNDDDYVDRFAREVHLRVQAEFASSRENSGRPFTLDGSIAAGYFGVSKGCGALPDGKRDGEPFADAVISPSAGTDRRGPTAVIKSASKITPPVYPTLLNQKFLPQFLEGDNRKLFASYLKTWFDLGIWHIQFNVADRQTLLDAQANPQSYTDLIVRVAGYSAYFIDLPKPLQDDIIRRVEQCLD